MSSYLRQPLDKEKKFGVLSLNSQDFDLKDNSKLNENVSKESCLIVSQELFSQKSQDDFKIFSDNTAERLMEENMDSQSTNEILKFCGYINSSQNITSQELFGSQREKLYNFSQNSSQIFSQKTCDKTINKNFDSQQNQYLNKINDRSSQTILSQKSDYLGSLPELEQYKLFLSQNLTPAASQETDQKNDFENEKESNCFTVLNNDENKNFYSYRSNESVNEFDNKLSEELSNSLNRNFEIQNEDSNSNDYFNSRKRKLDLSQEKSKVRKYVKDDMKKNATLQALSNKFKKATIKTPKKECSFDFEETSTKKLNPKSISNHLFNSSLSKTPTKLKTKGRNKKNQLPCKKRFNVYERKSSVDLTLSRKTTLDQIDENTENTDSKEEKEFKEDKTLNTSFSLNNSSDFEFSDDNVQSKEDKRRQSNKFAARIYRQRKKENEFKLDEQIDKLEKIKEKKLEDFKKLLKDEIMYIKVLKEKKIEQNLSIIYPKWIKNKFMKNFYFS